MTEGLLKFQDRITRKARKHFESKDEVNFEEFYEFVNFKMGTEFHEHYVKEFYDFFLANRIKTKDVKDH